MCRIQLQVVNVRRNIILFTGVTISNFLDQTTEKNKGIKKMLKNFPKPLRGERSITVSFLLSLSFRFPNVQSYAPSCEILEV